MKTSCKDCMWFEPPRKEGYQGYCSEPTGPMNLDGLIACKTFFTPKDPAKPKWRAYVKSHGKGHVRPGFEVGRVFDVTKHDTVIFWLEGVKSGGSEGWFHIKNSKTLGGGDWCLFRDGEVKTKWVAKVKSGEPIHRLSKNKEYDVLWQNSFSIKIVDDEGVKIICCKKSTSYLNGGDWELYEVVDEAAKDAFWAAKVEQAELENNELGEEETAGYTTGRIIQDYLNSGLLKPEHIEGIYVDEEIKNKGENKMAEKTKKSKLMKLVKVSIALTWVAGALTWYPVLAKKAYGLILVLTPLVVKLVNMVADLLGLDPCEVPAICWMALVAVVTIALITKYHLKKWWNS